MMKYKHCFLFVFILTLFFLDCRSQTAGFIQLECGIITNSAYQIENYHLGNHGYGYRLWHNGNVIAEEYGSLGGYIGMELRFLDNLTGYFVTFYGPWSSFYVYKIIDNNVTLLARIPGHFYNLYVVNKNTIYWASHFGSPNQIFMSRISDIQQGVNFAVNYNLSADTTAYDTISGVPNCSGFKELDYRFESTADTLTYKILIKADSLLNVNEKMTDFSIYPNPVEKNVRIRSSNVILHCDLQILDFLGRPVKKQYLNSINDEEIFLSDLHCGIYTIVIYNSKIFKSFNIVKL